MHERDIEKILNEALRRLGVEVRQEQIENGSGGFCRLDNDPIIVYSPDLSRKKRIDLFVQSLRNFDTSGIYLPPVIREILEEQDPDSNV